MFRHGRQRSSQSTRRRHHQHATQAFTGSEIRARGREQGGGEFDILAGVGGARLHGREAGCEVRIFARQLIAKFQRLGLREISAARSDAAGKHHPAGVASPHELGAAAGDLAVEMSKPERDIGRLVRQWTDGGEILEHDLLCDRIRGGHARITAHDSAARNPVRTSARFRAGGGKFLRNVCGMSSPTPPAASPAPVGRGARVNPANRFERLTLEPDVDFVEFDEQGAVIERPSPRTQFFDDASESVLTRNDSPDVPLDYGLNPYRGCEHGCSYCFARPFHEYLGFSSGLDFETKIMVKRRAPELLRAELSARRWQPQPIMLSGVTDCYQPAERRFRLTRGCLEVLAELRHPVAVITKNHLVTRDADLLAELARWQCASVVVSVTSLEADLASRLEPRASRPEHRLRAIRLLAEAGVPVGVNVAPVIPGLNDHEVPAILEASRAAGASFASYIVLRLPHAVKDVFLDWLDTHEPGKKARVLDRVRAMRGGQLYDSSFGTRRRGEGPHAEHLRQLFEVSRRHFGLARQPPALSTANFRRPGGTQLELL